MHAAYLTRHKVHFRSELVQEPGGKALCCERSAENSQAYAVYAETSSSFASTVEKQWGPSEI